MKILAVRVTRVLEFMCPFWATHIGDRAESGALQTYMRHQTVQTAQDACSTRSSPGRSMSRVVAACIGECLLCLSHLTPVWLYGSSPKSWRAIWLSRSRAVIHGLTICGLLSLVVEAILGLLSGLVW